MKTPWLFAVFWTLVILVACSLPGQDIPDISLFEYDKLAHFVMFAAFGWVWMYALRMPVRPRILWVLAGGIAYAFLTEVYQGLLPFERQPDLYDALANTGGLLTSVSLYWSILLRKQK